VEKMGEKINNYLKSRRGKSQIITLIFIIIYLVIRFEIATELLLIFNGVISALLFIVLVEVLLPYKDSLIRYIKPADTKKTPRIFEFGFFFFLFVATLVACFAAVGYYISDVGFKVLLNYWYFTVFYGIAISCGYYHYIRRLDN